MTVTRCSRLRHESLLPMIALLAVPALGVQHPQPGSAPNSAIDKTEHRSASAPQTPGGYNVGPGDVLQVEVWKEPEASIPSIVVRPDGKISLPFIGETQAAGLTPAGLQETLSAKYNQLIRDARVTVLIREVNSQKVYLIGEVRRQGALKLTAPITVLQALAEAGGLTDYAKTKKIYVLREANGGQVTFPFDYDAVLRGLNVQQNITLAPGDTIVVPH